MIIKAPAKINLFLEVLRRREDGYHDIQTIMVPISIYDEIELERHSDVILECNEASLPKDEKNLALKAAILYLKNAGIKEGVYIRLKKKIPISAGLGGGSSDAAAVLKGMNIIFRQFSKAELLSLAKEIGADVPFFLYESICLAKGIGDIIEPLPERRLYFLLITPEIKVSTKWVYNEYDKLDLTKKEQSSIKHYWEKSQIEALLKNDLERVTAQYFPVIKELKMLLIKVGAKGAVMSGSGPTVFGIFGSISDANKALKRLPANIGKLFVASSLHKEAWGVAKR